MIEIYHAGGAGDFSLLGPGLSPEQLRRLKFNAGRLLKARGEDRAAQLLESLPFEVIDASNQFGDDFYVLRAVVPLKQYEGLRQCKSSPTDRAAFGQIAHVINEIGPYIRFITADLILDAGLDSHPGDPQRTLSRSEIHKVVNRYLGVQGGYLADFTYRSHHEFYLELDLDINPYDYDGTTRERFIKILSVSPPHVQARILAGILHRYPVGSSEVRTQERYDEIRAWITRLTSTAPVPSPSPRITSEVVDRALADAEQLIRSTGATSGVDRVHTALHGYLRAVCDQAGVFSRPDASLTELFKSLREHHAAFKDVGPRADEIARILKAMSTTLDAMNTLRNRASVAHPNTVLLDEPEAMLVINSARTALHYIDAKLQRSENT